MRRYAILPCGTIIYRALLRQQWIDRRNSRVVTTAFLRRPQSSSKDQDGLSVNISNNCSIQEVISHFNSCYGIASLHVGRIRDIGLDVVQNTYQHANIVGLPYQEDNLVEAERFAGLLAKRSRIIWQR
jgi:hypothetical protein